MKITLEKGVTLRQWAEAKARRRGLRGDKLKAYANILEWSALKGYSENYATATAEALYIFYT